MIGREGPVEVGEHCSEPTSPFSSWACKSVLRIMLSVFVPREGLSPGHLTKRGSRGSQALNSTQLISWSAPKVHARTVWCEWHAKSVLCKRGVPGKLEKEVDWSHVLSFFVDHRSRPSMVAGKI